MDDVIRAITTYLERVRNYPNPWVVGVQLLLIAVVVWSVLRFLRGTRGARLLKGAAVLLATVYLFIRLLPKSAEWDRIEFLYRNFLFFAFVAIVVAFQPELRRAFIQIGQAKLFRGVRGHVEAMVDSLVEAAAYLSRNRIGAIIAMERSVGLGAIIKSGTTVEPLSFFTFFYTFYNTFILRCIENCFTLLFPILFLHGFHDFFTFFV